MKKIKRAREDQPSLAEIEQELREMVAKGWVRDSGQRRWDAETGRWEICWALTELGIRACLEPE
jgi:DNA-binding PadR family transcriptional regulator